MKNQEKKKMKIEVTIKTREKRLQLRRSVGSLRTKNADIQQTVKMSIQNNAKLNQKLEYVKMVTANYYIPKFAETNFIEDIALGGTLAGSPIPQIVETISKVVIATILIIIIIILNI